MKMGQSKSHQSFRKVHEDRIFNKYATAAQHRRLFLKVRVNALKNVNHSGNPTTNPCADCLGNHKLLGLISRAHYLINVSLRGTQTNWWDLFNALSDDECLINLWNEGLGGLKLQRKMAERIKVIPVCCEGIRKIWWRHGDDQESKPPVRKILPGWNQNLGWRNHPASLLCLLTDTDTCEGRYVISW